jgi:uncharacterized membrane protein
VSLKAFHLFFIALSIVLAAFVAAWATSQYRLLHQTTYIVTAVVSALAGAGLAVYGTRFQRKTRGL